MGDSPQDETEVRRIHERRLRQFEDDVRRLDARSNRLANARLASFLFALAALVWGFFGDTTHRAAFVAAGALGLLGFVALVVLHRRVARELDRAGELVEINLQAIARLERDWSRLPKWTGSVEAAKNPISIDLDLFGPRSLFRLVAVGSTILGRQALGRWFVEPAEPETIVRRQQVVTDLAPQLDLRQECMRVGVRAQAAAADPERFLGWAETEPWLLRRPGLIVASRALPLLLVTLALLQLTGALSASLWVLALVAQLTLSFQYCGRIHETFGRVSDRAGRLGEYVEQFRLVGGAQGASSQLVEIRAALAAGTDSALVHLRRLGKIMDLADLRFSQMVYGVVQALTLWDFHVLALAEGWQIRAGHQARRWFEQLGEFEALSSLASLAYDNPDWPLPSFASAGEESRLVAAGVAHPYLKRQARVANDVTLGPPGSFLLVTGSNMSGKSTLLRSIGVNVVLAQAGGPVCARSFSLPPVRLGTSFRVQDDLGDGVSLFMAELRRLKQIVDEAVETQRRGDRIYLFLLDEILHGTNTAERQIAVRRVIGHLVAHAALGAVSTHDLALADVAELNRVAHPVHFRESFSDGDQRQMTFDYRLHAGVATTTNALQLLRIVGLDLNGDSSPAASTNAAPANEVIAEGAE